MTHETRSGHWGALDSGFGSAPRARNIHFNLLFWAACFSGIFLFLAGAAEITLNGWLRPDKQALAHFSPLGLLAPNDADPAESANAPCKFQPFIPDSPDLPQTLATRREKINRLIDSALQRIEAFERERGWIDPREALRRLDRIDRTYREAYAEIRKALGYRLCSPSPLIMDERNREYLRWYYPVAIEVRERGRMWQSGAELSRRYLEFEISEWLRQREGARSGVPSYRSDFHRETHYQDFTRIVYFYRESGGVESCVQVAQLILELEKERLADNVAKLHDGHANP